MIILGKWNDLITVKTVSFGAYLGETQKAPEKERILLPAKQVPEGLSAGDPLTVFVYRDSDDRMIATVHKPALTLGEVARLTVRQVTKVGAFLDWGLEKDLLLPFHEQTKKVGAGEEVLAALYTDKSGRLCATMNVYPYLSKSSPYRAGQTVEGTVYETSQNFGAFVAVDDLYSGLIPKRELTGQTAEIGRKYTLRVSRVLKDGRLELSLRDKAYKQMDTDADAVLEKIRTEYHGTLPFDDKAEPAVIKDAFGMSKAAFKRAVGHLYKEKKIDFSDGTIVLTAKNTKKAKS